ncbi:uncharacterized protein [Nicotiana sylvestris]|uniref:uncharacterized protein n=1 Tax=Nicotiana sylvestris TaxID=4096 RepID=UPI00388C3BFB
MVRDCPRLMRGEPPQTSQSQRAPQSSQAMVTAPVATPPAQPAKGGGRGGRGHPRWGGQARYYGLPTRTEAVASDFVITVGLNRFGPFGVEYSWEERGFGLTLSRFEITCALGHLK